MSYNSILSHLSVRGRIEILAKSPRMVSLFKVMRFVFIYRLLWRTKLKMWKVHMHRTPHLKGIVGVILHKLGFLHPLGKGGGNLQLDRTIMKALGSEGVNVEEFLVDTSKSRTKSSYALL